VSEHKRAVKRAWYAKNKERINAERRAVPSDKRDSKRAGNRRWYAAHTPEKRLHWQNYMRVYGLKRRFKLSLVQWLAIFTLQGERCACCKATSGGARWHTDHDHQTGAIRGIICVACNTTLGRLGDSLRAVEDATVLLTTYLKGAEAVWQRGGDKPADSSDRLIPWTPSE
jgi:hypothetical protein